MMRRLLSLAALFALANPIFAGVNVVRGNGITLTGADGVNFIGVSGITLTGADGLLTRQSNGITLTGADGITLTGADGITSTGADGVTYAGANGITLTGADGISLAGADGITLTGADGITLTGADGTTRIAERLFIVMPSGITLTGADGITLTGADGITLTGADGITLTGADGITLTGADGITLTGADSVTGISLDGVLFDLTQPAGITLTGADGITLTGADGITLTGADGITLTGADGGLLPDLGDALGLQSFDAELAKLLNTVTDDSGLNAVVVFHEAVTEADLDQLRSLGVLGGTRFRVLPAVMITASKHQLAAISRLPQVRSIYGNRTLSFDSDPYFNITGIRRAAADADLRSRNAGLPYTGSGVTVAVLDTGVNALHPDLAGRVVQNVKLADVQGLPLGFVPPLAIEGLPNTDLVAGHGTLVGGIIAGSGTASGGKFAGVAPGAKIMGLSAGDAGLLFVLSGLDHLLDKGPAYGVRVVNCSFSAATVYDPNDPVNVATKMLTERGVNVVFSAGNSGPGNGTINPYAMAPWVVAVGATDHQGRLASYSGRGSFGNAGRHPTVVAPGTNIVGPRSLVGLTGVTGLIGADLQRLTLAEIPFYTTATGTSFSAPQVSAAIALMLEANPGLSPAEVKDILARTATPMPGHFRHEAGAGMLNTHAAVLKAAFPDRRFGTFRSVLPANGVRFSTGTSQVFEGTVETLGTASADVPIPPDTVQASISIAWRSGVNDLGLRVLDTSNRLLAESNQLNLLGLTGTREKVVLHGPAAQPVRVSVRHTIAGTSQPFFGAVELTRVEFPQLADLDQLPAGLAAEARRSMMANLLLPSGNRLRPHAAATRLELAEALVRAGLVPQYTAASPRYSDVTAAAMRNAVESSQASPSGPIFADAAGAHFAPHGPVTKLAAAIAYVRAAGLESRTRNAYLPLTVADAFSVPSAWRGHVAVALKEGFITLDGSRFAPGRSVTRIELASSLNRIVSRP